jgi:hypothetical protein
MIGSLYAGISGLNANSWAMSVIGDNIANVNTTGFKSSRPFSISPWRGIPATKLEKASPLLGWMLSGTRGLLKQRAMPQI